MDIQERIKEYWDVKCQIANLQTRERILCDIISEGITEPILVPFGHTFLSASINDRVEYIVPMRYLPHIDQDKGVAQFYDGREIDLEELTVRSLSVKIG